MKEESSKRGGDEQLNKLRQRSRAQDKKEQKTPPQGQSSQVIADSSWQTGGARNEIRKGFGGQNQTKKKQNKRKRVGTGGSKHEGMGNTKRYNCKPPRKGMIPGPTGGMTSVKNALQINRRSPEFGPICTTHPIHTFTKKRGR